MTKGSWPISRWGNKRSWSAGVYPSLHRVTGLSDWLTIKLPKCSPWEHAVKGRKQAGKWWSHAGDCSTANTRWRLNMQRFGVNNIDPVYWPKCCSVLLYSGTGSHYAIPWARNAMRVRSEVFQISAPNWNDGKAMVVHANLVTCHVLAFYIAHKVTCLHIV